MRRRHLRRQELRDMTRKGERCEERHPNWRGVRCERRKESLGGDHDTHHAEGRTFEWIRRA